MRKILGLIILLLFSASALYAQIKSDDNTKALHRDGYYLSLSPAHLILGGLKLELSKPVIPSMVVYASPEFYSAELFNDSGRVKGIGLHSGVKLGLSSDIASGGDTRWTYFQFGLEYNHFTLNQIGNIWKPITVNGNPALIYEAGEIKTRINRIGAHLLFGGLYYSKDRFFYELAAGASIRKSYFTNDDFHTSTNKHDQKPWKFGWSGITPLIYWKFGFVLG